MNFFKKHFKPIVAIAHGIFLFAMLWQVTNSSWSSNIDEEILSQVNSLRSGLFGNKIRYDHRFVFINVSKDLKLVPDPEEYGAIPITDRNKLAEFFKILADNANQHYYVLCDIFFEYPSDDDTSLSPQLQRCKNLLFPFHLTNDSVKLPCLPVDAAFSDFITYTGGFSKFKLMYKDSIKTIPLVLLEKIDEKRYPSTFLDFANIFPHYYITQNQLTNTKKYPYFNLGELLMLSETPTFYDEFLKDKFIVIGNFESDIHDTPVGKMPGPLILLNSYLTIRNESHAGWLWAIFMIAGLSYTSYLLFFLKVKPPDVGKRPWLDFIMEIFVNKYFSFSGICLVLIILSTFIFSVQTNMSAVLMYLLTINFLKIFYEKHYKKGIKTQK